MTYVPCMHALRAQVFCYEDSKLLKLFSDIVRILYDHDVVAEDTIMWCAGSPPHPGPTRVSRLFRRLGALLITSAFTTLPYVPSCEGRCMLQASVLAAWQSYGSSARSTMSMRRRWYKKGANPKGRNVFMRDMEPFIKWLEEAEEDEDGE